MKNYNKKIFNYGIITVILFLSIYFLYFYENTNSSIIKENFNNSYINICKDKPTHFYNMPTSNTNLINDVTDIRNSQDCRKACDDTSNCSLYFMKIAPGSKLSDVGYNDISNCYIYKGNLDSSRIDKNNIDININCINNTLPNTGDTVYNGYGYVNTQYFKDNKDKFDYIDYYLDEANNFINKIKDINEEKKRVFDSDKSRDTLQYKYDNFTKDVDNLNQHLNIDKNKLNSIYITNEDSVLSSDIYNIPFNDTSYNLIDYIDKNYKNIKQNDFLKQKIDNTNKKNTTIFIIYIILLIIMIITILLLLLYKLAPKYINDLVIISYFIGIIFLLLFLKFNKNITI